MGIGNRRYPSFAIRAAGALAILSIAATPSTQPTIPLIEGLGSYTRTVTTDSAEAQRYFNQGLALTHGFNHGAAIRSFQEAARLDPDCAMAHWGIAYAAGPHINFPAVPPPMAELAWKELALARSAKHVSPVEKEVIEALSHRYANPQPEDRTGLDRAYADAMRELWHRHPDDPDIGAWFAESLMDLRPWDQWSAKGQPEPGTEEVISTLDAVLKLNQNHPFANHLYIHALEASPTPERALPAADRLRDLQPGLAHNVHMPSHIDIRVGNWQKAVVMNQKAVEADRKYRDAVGPPTGMLIVYSAHNRHMLSFAAMMTGQSRLAIDHIRAMAGELPDDFIRQFSLMAEGFLAMPDEVLVRFGKWDDILNESFTPKDYTPFTNAFHHAARAIALAAKGDTAGARAEQKTYAELATKIPAEETIHNNTAADICAVITPMVEGEILLREGKADEGIASLRAAVALEDTLKYDEPPGWLIPVRHSLGANLLNQGKYAEAEQVYRADLARLPGNGWSLYGLSRALQAQGKTEEANATMTAFRQVWSHADMQINSSCLCRPLAEAKVQ